MKTFLLFSVIITLLSSNYNQTPTQKITDSDHETFEALTLQYPTEIGSKKNQYWYAYDHDANVANPCGDLEVMHTSINAQTDHPFWNNQLSPRYDVNDKWVSRHSFSMGANELNINSGDVQNFTY